MAALNEQLSSLSDFRVVAWNACGVKQKINKLSVFLGEFHVDVLLISETWLRPYDRLSLISYRVYRSDRLVGRHDGPLTPLYAII